MRESGDSAIAAARSERRMNRKHDCRRRGLDKGTREAVGIDDRERLPVASVIGDWISAIDRDEGFDGFRGGAGENRGRWWGRSAVSYRAREVRVANSRKKKGGDADWTWLLPKARWGLGSVGLRSRRPAEGRKRRERSDDVEVDCFSSINQSSKRARIAGERRGGVMVVAVVGFRGWHEIGGVVVLVAGLWAD